MTHSNPDAFDIETAYCIAIKNLIQNHDKEEKAEIAFDAALAST